jgi:cytochrome c-type biogenesis protein CcmE
MLGPFEAKEQLDTLPGLRVNYQGILPDMFAEGRDVIVEGKYEDGQSLIAKTIMTRCPSKYEPEKPETQAKATNP